jgi:hypothetical protein
MFDNQQKYLLFKLIFSLSLKKIDKKETDYLEIAGHTH